MYDGNMRQFRIAIGLLAVLPWIGCLPKAPLHPPPAPPPEILKPDLQSHLLGPWELPAKNGAVKRIVFEVGGRLRFEGAFEFYNPATWELDSAREELILHLPAAPEEKLDIFKMYVGDGVQAFDRANKQVTYHFNTQVWELNVAGWPYHKPDASAPPPLAEPVLK
jgi:hypothetical protein